MRTLLSGLPLRHLSAVCAAIALASGCVAASDADGAGPPNLAEAGQGPINKVITLDSGSHEDAGAVDGGLLINPLCGTADYCLSGGTPDNDMACAQYEAGTGRPGLPDAGVATRDASHHEASDSSDASLDGAIADSGPDSRDASAELPIPAPMQQPIYACQVGRDNSDRPVHQCVPSGSGAEGSPCTKVSECAPGLGCVGSERLEPIDSSTGETGRCFHYCCGVRPDRPSPTTDCSPKTYCAERRLLDGTTKKPLIVPVCAPGELCGLLEPYPCEGAGCSCPASTSCTIVGGDGTKGCVKPGAGKVGDHCPCAAGYYCSLATSTCAKMCKTDGIDDRCAPGRCQAAAGFPPGFGICVGYTPAKQ